DGVFARWQVGVAGPTRHGIRSQVRAQRWQTFGTRVVVTHTGPLSPLQRQWAALLHCGKHAVLCSATAAELGGLRGYESPRVHVSVPAGTHVTPNPEIALHFRRGVPADVQPGREPPRSRICVAVVDMAVSATDVSRACAVLAAGVQQRLLLPVALRDELARRPRVRHRRLLIAVVNDIEGGAHALGEIDFARLCRKYGLPPPSRQRIRKDRYGRRRYLDVFWDDFRLVVEIDGAAHMEVTAWWADMRRQNDIVLGPNRVLRFASLMVRSEADDVMAQVRTALELSGWRPSRDPRAVPRHP
ncbi:MAG: endonuclease domain-containing protein, partial [Frankia sp.]|nr:endonuclease domain-containing protein [Frankia sp.]